MNDLTVTQVDGYLSFDDQTATTNILETHFQKFKVMWSKVKVPISGPPSK